jgi:group II intron reverse transcriptase/maturase
MDKQRSELVSTKQRRIAELAKQISDKPLTSLSHRIDVDWMKEAVRRTRKNAAAGVDGVTADGYANNLEANLEALLGRMKTGQYRAPPVRRVMIPKGNGKNRPIGVPTYEDKVLQRAVAMAIEPVYEQIFHPFSYGFRPERGAHDALEALWKALSDVGGGWVLDVDVQSFFDDLDHAVCRELLGHRVRDGVITRMIGKWLNAGVLEGGVVKRVEKGTPQGGVISPLLANIYLHYVLDEWWVVDVLPRLRGRAFLIRYADDFVMVFANGEDAQRVQAVLGQRFAKYGLTLNQDKTRLLRFEPPSGKRTGEPTEGPPRRATFDFLGFTHYWGKSRKGSMIVMRKTMSSRLTRAIRKVYEWCRRARHVPEADQAKRLRKMLTGHYSYYGITGNKRALHDFFRAVQGVWHKWLCRRSQRSYVRWDVFAKMVKQYRLPLPKVVHSVYAARP